MVKNEIGNGKHWNVMIWNEILNGNRKERLFSYIYPIDTHAPLFFFNHPPKSQISSRFLFYWLNIYIVGLAPLVLSWMNNTNHKEMIAYFFYAIVFLDGATLKFINIEWNLNEFDNSSVWKQWNDNACVWTTQQKYTGRYTLLPSTSTYMFETWTHTQVYSHSLTHTHKHTHTLTWRCTTLVYCDSILLLCPPLHSSIWIGGSMTTTSRYTG